MPPPMACPRRVLLSAVLCATFCRPAAAQPPAEAEVAPADAPPPVSLGPRLRWSADFSVAGILDESLRGSLGRERQIKPVIAVLSLDVRVSPNASLHLETNPVRDDRAPRPYVPDTSDRRTYFFPNQPDVVGGRGVASQPEGLYKVDQYKHTGLDPILQTYLLRTGYADLHTASGRMGVRVGRVYVRQGLGLDELTWFTAKDLTTIQLLNAQADNGLALYGTAARIALTAQVVSGNGSPYHDYGYFDFTDPAEDKNSSFGVVLDARRTLWRGRLLVGGSVRRNRVNSRIEDSITLQLSKHVDDARLVYARATWPRVQVYGEWAQYTVGLAPTSAALLKGPAVTSPVPRPGGYVGVQAGPLTFGHVRASAIVEQEAMSRNDALVAYAAANDMFGVRLGAHITGTNAKLLVDWGAHVSSYAFVRAMTNPFPELSAIVPVSGPDAGRSVSHTKIGVGLRMRF
ncbi:MAG: hypothetical protein U0802_09670 [Candidatus Binatia bacterium]